MGRPSKLTEAILQLLDERAQGWDQARGVETDFKYGACHEARALAAQVRELIKEHGDE